MDALAPLAEGRKRLDRRGPAGAALARYLSCRMDLLTETEALELEAEIEIASVTPYREVQEIFEAETGQRLDEAFDRFEAEPFEVDLLCQWHRARLMDGEVVVFKLVHSDLRPAAGPMPRPKPWPGLEEVSKLAPVLSRSGASDRERVLADFADHWTRSLDLGREATDLIELRERCETMSLVTVPEVHPALSGARFLTVADLCGSTATERARPPAERAGADGPRLARRLCRAWLRLGFSASTVPVDPRGRNVLFLEDGKVAFCGGPFQPLPGHSRDLLREYLVATTIGDQQSCADAFLDLHHARSRQDERRLRHQLRHTAPFRDGGWDPGSDSLSRALLAHWHQAAVLGFRPRRPLRTFLSGLALLTREAGRLAPGENSFREAFQELRLYELLSESARLATGGEAAPMADLPRKLDRGLTLAAAESRPRRERAQESRGGSWSVVIALFAAIAAVVLLVHHIAPDVGAPMWIERSGAVLVLVLGGLLLRFAAE